MLEEKLGKNNTHRKLEESEDIKKRKRKMLGLCVLYTAVLISSFELLSSNEQPNNYGSLKKQGIEKIDTNKYSVIIDSTKYFPSKHGEEINGAIYTKIK